MNEGIRKLTEKLRSPKVLIVAGLCGMALILLSSFLSGGKKEDSTRTTESGGISAEEYRVTLEENLKEMVRRITGSRHVKVVITLESGVRYSYADTQEGSAVNQIESDRESTNSEMKQGYITVRTADGGEQALLVTEEMPQVRGVAIVCEGGDSEQIRENVTNAVMAALHITSKRVYVTGGNWQ